MNTSLSKPTMLTTKISWYYLPLALMLMGAILFFTDRKATEAAASASSPDCNIVVSRLSGYNYIMPLLTAEQKYENPRFESLKEKVNKLVNDKKTEATLTEASIYLRDFQAAEWMTYNPEGKYHPGSLIKVPLLITYLRMAEINPALLDEERKFDLPADRKLPSQFFESKAIEPGKVYSVRQLLQYMIAHSDNNATYLLTQKIDPAIIQKLFTDMGLPIPMENDPNFTITAEGYSNFLKTVFNSTYLSMKDSEYAASLLSECTFNEGFVKGFPSGTKMFHKFGESGDGVIKELHESGVFFINDKPYLLTVMTKGTDLNQLAEALSQIAKMVYDELSEGS